MTRREFITFLGGAASWPFAARAQQPMLVIGFLSTRARDESAHLVEAFRRGLAENGYTESRNVAIEYRWAFGQYDRLPGWAAELARRPVTLFVTGGDPAAQAAKAATSTIPIIFGRRSRQTRTRRELQPAGRKCHRDKYFDQHAGTQAAWSIA
jgi:putative ABC transport system substrate-binding protein